MCIAQTSNPATNLSWYINGEPVRYLSSIEKIITILEIQALSIKKKKIILLKSVIELTVSFHFFQLISSVWIPLLRCQTGGRAYKKFRLREAGAQFLPVLAI